MCVAVAIVAGIGVAGTVSAAKMSSNASKNASKAQAAAGDQAIAFQREQYAQSREDFKPYAAAGGAALGRMGAQGGTPVQGFRQGPPAQLGMPQLGSPTPAGQSGPAPAGQMMPTMQPQPMGPGRQLSAQGAPQAAGGALWTIQAPDGATKQLPPEQAQQFIQHGARRVA